MIAKLQDEPKSSLKVMMNSILKPDLGMQFTMLGTSRKAGIINLNFYKIMRSVITSKFSGPLVSHREIEDIMDATTKSYFHNVRDKVVRRVKPKAL
ncbi:unnamed protein product [Heterobilharzia americana]|nr:unnamed protein product [Heterobilharzia americana]CAH8667504.1 unnamed protein product [Heterobilharzia americana]